MKIAIALTLCVALSACQREAPPRTIADFEADRSALDAKLVSCRADRRAAIKDVECQHARTAANRIAMAEESERKSQLEKNSQRQLDALRRQRSVADSQQKAREAALVQSGESKLARGLPLTDAEARALGIDPENSMLTQSGEAARAAQQVAGDAQRVVQDAANDRAENVDAANEAPGTDVPEADAPKTLAEIRESLNKERDDEDDDE